MLLFLSCNKTLETKDLPLHGNIDLTTIEGWTIMNNDRLHEVTYIELSQIQNEKLQKEIFNIIPAINRAQIWKDKIDEILKVLVSEKQILLLNEIKSKLNEDLYNPLSKNDAINYQYFKNLSIRLKSTFGESQAREYFTQIGNNTTINSSNLTPVPPKDCNCRCSCSTADDWCPSLGECKAGADSCKAKSWGCGGFWWFSCDGACKLFGDGEN